MTDPLKGADIGDAASVVRAEWRADEEEWTRAGLERWRHERSLLDLLRECMHRGDTIALSLSLGTFTFTGCVIAVGVDLVTLNLADGPVDVCCNPEAPLVVRVTERARSGGTRGDAVKKLQEKLGVGADGQFGPGTEKAVRDYQQKNGLVVDGAAGPATLAHMKLFKEITADTVRASQVPNVAGGAAAAGAGMRSIWDTIKSVFK